MKGKDVVKLLEQNGWRVDRINGSHHIMKKTNYPIIPVPVHPRDLKTGTLNKILKDAGLK